MKVTVFLEGRPGHEKQSLAIIQALQTMVAVEVKQVQLKASHPIRRIWDVCQLLFMPGGGCGYCLDDTDLLIGTGSRTHVALLACKKKYNIPAVTCMAPDAYLRHRFDLCFVPRHDGLKEAKNIFLTDGPPVMSAPDLPRNAKTGLILLGGVDTSSHEWNSDEISEYVHAIADEQPDIHWNVSSSPRTPQRSVELMAKIEGALPNVSFFHYRDTPRGWVEEQYAKATYAWVTADSISMIYEAITAGCKVGILPVQWKNANNKFQKSIDFLVERGLAVPFAERRREGFARCNAGTFDEARRCAGEIAARYFSICVNTGNGKYTGRK